MWNFIFPLNLSLHLGLSISLQAPCYIWLPTIMYWENCLLWSWTDHNFQLLTHFVSTKMFWHNFTSNKHEMHGKAMSTCQNCITLHKSLSQAFYVFCLWNSVRTSWLKQNFCTRISNLSWRLEKENNWLNTGFIMDYFVDHPHTLSL